MMHDAGITPLAEVRHDGWVYSPQMERTPTQHLDIALTEI
jgi:hypothetical protein